MTDPLTIVLPVPPSVNALYRNAPGRGRVKTRAYRDWLETVGPVIREAHREAGAPTIGQPLSLGIVTGIGRQRDLGGVLKAAEDALVKFLPGCPDDKWNDEINLLRSERVDPDFAVVTLTWPEAPPG